MNKSGYILLREIPFEKLTDDLIRDYESRGIKILLEYTDHETVEIYGA